MRVRLDRVVHAQDVGRALEGGAHVLGHGDAPRFIRPVDLGDDGRQHRRAGGHFHHLGVAAVAPGDGGDLVAHRHGNLVALALALVLVHQVHLHVAQLAGGAQVVLAHQAVEVDGTGRTRVGLVVGDFLHFRHVAADLAQHLGGLLHGRAHRHVQHHLELGLVVEGQHLEHHQLYRGQGHGHQDRHQHAQPQLEPGAPARTLVQERRQHAAEQPIQPGVEPALAARGVMMLGEQLHRQPGRHHEGDGQRDQHAHGRVDGDGAHIGPHQAGDEGHGQQCGDDREGGKDGGPAHFVHGAGDDLPQGLVRVQLAPAVDVLHHHDGVIHQDADGEDQGEQGHPVQGEAPGPGGEQGGRQGEGHGQADDQGLAPPQGEQHQQHHGTGGEHQLADELLGLVGGGGAVVAGDGEFHALGNDAALEGLGAGDDRLGHVGGVDPRLLGDRQGDRGEFAFLGAVPDIVGGLIRPVLHPRHVGHEHGLAPVHPHHQALHVGRRLDVGAGLHQHFLVARDQAARGLYGVGHLQRGAQVLGGDAVGVHAVRVHDDPDHVAGTADGGDVAGAGNALELDLRGARHLLQLEGRALRIGGPEGEADDGYVVDALGLDDGLAHAQVGRHPVAVGVEGIVEAHQRLDGVLAHLVLYGDHRHARARHGVHVLDAGDARQHLLRRARHQGLHVLGRGAREGNEHIGHGDVDLGLLLPRRDEHGEQAQQEGDQGHQRRQLIALEISGDASGNTHFVREAGGVRSEG